ncbi:Cro/Cl family transcriptional regulator [Caballeronia sp. DA-9]|uniref:Cro/Cl family transcriptional regulator n=1 Tax=Caballeronia sp. DA-9 TaxID=3436237 RepID=UPI003F6800A5
MKTTVDYLDAVKKRLNLPSDYAIAKALHVTRAAVSSYRVGRTSFDNLTALRVAEILDVQPFEVIAAANVERARDDETRSLWEHAWGKAVGATAAVTLTACVVGLSVAPTPAQAASVSDESASVYIM